MSLTVRLIRALWVFGLIFASYMIQLGLVRVFRRISRDPATNKEVIRVPEWLKRRRQRVDQKGAKRLLGAILRLRGVYIKMGQVLSIMGGFLPRVYTNELEQLQDQVPPVPFKVVEETMRRAFGKPPQQVFRDIDEQPLAAASLGQVHVAHLQDGTKVAVKILYPMIRDVIRVDMRVLRLAVKVYQWFFPVQNIERVHAQLVEMLRRETEYLHEAEMMTRMARNFEGEEDILFPRVITEHTTRDVLTMTFMEGIKITRFDEIEKAGIDRTAVATRLVQSFYKQLFVDHLFHADPHPGNFLVLPGPKIVVLDFGAVSVAHQEILEGLLDMVQAVFTQNEQDVLKGFKRMGFVAVGANDALIERTVLTYFKKLLKVKDRTPGALTRAKRSELEQLADPELERGELRELMRSIQYPPDWFYIERACVLMFWLCGQIDPELDTMQVGFPYVMPLLMNRSAQYQASPEAESA